MRVRNFACVAVASAAATNKENANIGCCTSSAMCHSSSLRPPASRQQLRHQTTTTTTTATTTSALKSNEPVLWMDNYRKKVSNESAREVKEFLQESAISSWSPNQMVLRTSSQHPSIHMDILTMKPLTKSIIHICILIANYTMLIVKSFPDDQN